MREWRNIYISYGIYMYLWRLKPQKLMVLDNAHVCELEGRSGDELNVNLVHSCDMR